MELKSHFDFRKLFTILYIVAFLVYLIIGLQPAKATEKYEISGSLEIPSLSLVSDVTTLTLHDQMLDVPDTIVGSYSRAENKTFLVGHSSTVFQNLNQIEIGAEIKYDNKTYLVESAKVYEKSAIKMNALLEKADVDTLIIMTCAGEIHENNDATHRLIVTAKIAVDF